MSRAEGGRDSGDERDHRREKRLADQRIGLGRFSGEECLALVQDVSMSGARVALYTTKDVPEEVTIAVDASYEDDWVTFRGHVRYAFLQDGAWVVGIRCIEDGRRQAFLASRYAA